MDSDDEDDVHDTEIATMLSDRQHQVKDADERITQDDEICSVSATVMTGDPANVVSTTKTITH